MLRAGCCQGTKTNIGLLLQSPLRWELASLTTCTFGSQGTEGAHWGSRWDLEKLIEQEACPEGVHRAPRDPETRRPCATEVRPGCSHANERMEVWTFSKITLTQKGRLKTYGDCRVTLVQSKCCQTFSAGTKYVQMQKEDVEGQKLNW